jgi:hypothetical protein
VAILLILPLAPLTLIGLDGWAATAEQLLPLAPARDMFNAILFETNPRDAIVEGSVNLMLIASVTATLATWKLRRLA